MKKTLGLILTLSLLSALLTGCSASVDVQTEPALPVTAQTAAEPDAAQTAAEPDAAPPAATVQTVELAQSVQLLGADIYFGYGAQNAAFTVNGQTVSAVPVDAAGTIFRWSAAELAGGTVYGTVDVPYADFFYGELNALTPPQTVLVDTAAGESDTLESYRDVGMYDAVTSATRQKWQQQAGTYTQPLESGGQILGVTDVCVAVDAQLYVNACILNALGVSTGTALEGFTAAMTLTEAPAAVYKTLYADGTLSAAVGTVTQGQGGFSISSGGRYGDYELRADGVRLSGTILGVVITAQSGSFGLCHLENIWGNGRELAWRCFASDKNTTGRFLPYEALARTTITQVRYITTQGVTVYDGLSIAVG